MFKKMIVVIACSLMTNIGAMEQGEAVQIQITAAINRVKGNVKIRDEAWRRRNCRAIGVVAALGLSAQGTISFINKYKNMGIGCLEFFLLLFYVE